MGTCLRRSGHLLFSVMEVMNNSDSQAEALQPDSCVQQGQKERGVGEVIGGVKREGKREEGTKEVSEISGCLPGPGTPVSCLHQGQGTNSPGSDC